MKAHSWKHDGRKSYKCPEFDCSMTRSWGYKATYEETSQLNGGRFDKSKHE